MKKTVAQNKKILSVAGKISKAIELEAEEILDHAEQVIKQYVPARYVKAALTKIEKKLEDEGIEALFDKTVSREALRKTASEQPTVKELNEVVNKVTAAIVAEMEDVLKDTDDVIGEKIAGVTDMRKKAELEAKLKSVVEKKTASKGIYFKLARMAKK
jgi:predicted ATP-dependent Lon-type protease